MSLHKKCVPLYTQIRNDLHNNGSVAQASDYGSEGCRFESCRSHTRINRKEQNCFLPIFVFINETYTYPKVIRFGSAFQFTKNYPLSPTGKIRCPPKNRKTILLNRRLSVMNLHIFLVDIISVKIGIYPILVVKKVSNTATHTPKIP